MKKIFRRRNIPYYLAYYLLIEAVSHFKATIGILGYIGAFFQLLMEANDMMTVLRGIVILVLMIGFWLVAISIAVLPVTVFILAFKSADVVLEKENTKYDSQKDLLYYRDYFQNISPTTISLMQNLEVETEKDLTATLLKLQLNGNINIKENHIEVISDHVKNLTPSEIQLLDCLASQKFSAFDRVEWKKTAIIEAENQGLLVTNQKKKMTFQRKIIYVLSLFVMGLICYKSGEKFLEIYEQIPWTELSDDLPIFALAKEADLFHQFFGILFFGLMMLGHLFGILGWPLFGIFYMIRFKSKRNRLARTKKGEALTDEILAMKRFIHEFSTLDEASQNECLLWDDFLVYAIVLEENIKIVDEMLALKKLKHIHLGSLLKKDMD